VQQAKALGEAVRLIRRNIDQRVRERLHTSAYNTCPLSRLVQAWQRYLGGEKRRKAHGFAHTHALTILVRP
jgi:hypothetical protein